MQPYEEVGFLHVSALRALAVQLLDRRRSGSIISALGSGGQSSQLSQLVYRAVTGVTVQSPSPDHVRCASGAYLWGSWSRHLNDSQLNEVQQETLTTPRF